MRTTSALAITMMALVGLVVSVTAAWSQLTSVTSMDSGLGPPVAGIQAPRDDRGGARDERPSLNHTAAEVTATDQPTRPIRVALADVGIDAAVRPVGVAADGQMQLPASPWRLGWYRFGPVPDSAARGSAVLAGHLDSNRYGLGPLVRLRDVETGDSVQVTLADGLRVTYRVATVARYDQQAIPAGVFARSGTHRLRIITCGGDYDANAGGYQQNLVVTAVPA